MSEIKIIVEDRYLETLLSFLQTVNYVKVGEVRPNGEAARTRNATTELVAALPSDDPMRAALKNPRKDVTLEELVRESGYKGTDWDAISKIGKEMDIPQEIDELLEQLSR
jgi:hypothetical protein